MVAHLVQPAEGGDRAPTRRAAVVLALLIAGLAIGRWLGPGVAPATLFAMACGACALALVGRGWACRVALSIGVVAFGAGWFGARLYEVDATSLSGRLAPATGPASVITVEGIVVRTTEPREGPEPVLTPLPFSRAHDRLELAVRAVDDGARSRATGVLRVFGPSLDLRSVRAGDVIRVTGTARRIEGPSNPGERDWALLARQRGVVGSMRAATIDRLDARTLTAPDRWRAGWWRWREQQQGKAEAILIGPDDTPGRALLGAIVLGVRDGQVEATTDVFMRQGLGHLLAISGFHVAVMAGATLLLVRLTGDHGRLEPLIVGALIIAYLLILPPRTSVLRAGVLVLALLASEAAGRRYDRVNLLAWIACIMLLIRPLDAWNMGFQLTFGVTAALMLLYARTLERLLGEQILISPRPRRSLWRRRVVEPIATLFVASLVAWTVAAPAVIYHTGIVSPLAIASTMLLTPLIALSLGLSFGALAIGVLAEPLAASASWLIGMIAGSAVDLVSWIDAIPGTSWRIAQVSIWWTVCATAVGVHWLTRGHWKRITSWLATLLVVAWLLVQVGPGTAQPRDVLVRVDAIDVGSGSCLLVRSGADAMLWDCGSTSVSMGRRLAPTIRALGAGPVRSAIITHANYDHFSSLPDSMGALGVRTVLVGPSFVRRARQSPASNASRLIEHAGQRGVDVRVLEAGDTFTLGHARVEIISPHLAFARENDNSLVARLTVRDDAGREHRVLLTGDIEAPAIDALLDRGLAGAAIIEAPHHGSATEATLRFVAATTPTVVLQSTSGSRAGDARLEPARRGRRWYATPIDGACWAEVRADGTLRSGSMRTTPVVDRPIADR